MFSWKKKNNNSIFHGNYNNLMEKYNNFHGKNTIIVVEKYNNFHGIFMENTIIFWLHNI